MLARRVDEGVAAASRRGEGQGRTIAGADVKGTAASLDASDTTRMRRGAGATRVTPRAARAGSEATPPSSTEEIHAEAMLAGK